MSYQGDIRLGATIEFTFTTRRFSTGAPYALAGGSLAAYQTGSSTPITSGITLTASYNSVTGLNHVSIAATSGNGFATAKDVSVVIAAGTVDSVSVVGETVGSFSIENRSAVMPTTVGRTLDISAGGEAGVDWANVGSPTTSNALTGTTIATSQVVASVSGAVGSVTGLTASNLDTTVSSRMATYTQPTGFLAATFPTTVASTTNITAGVITTVTNLTNAPTSGDFTATMKTSLNAATPSVTISDKTGFSLASTGLNLVTAWTVDITGSLSGSVGSVTADVDANIVKVNSITVDGAGTSGDPWGPA